MEVQKRKLSNITIALPQIYLECLDLLKDMQRYSSRSEGIRIAIKTFLNRETDFKEELILMTENDGFSNDKKI